MGDQLGKCCCDSECCGGGFEADELPSLTITGMTGGGWSSIVDCCAVQDFTYNAAQTINKDCQQMRSGTRVEFCEQERYIREQQNPFNTCPIDPCGDIVLCGTESYEATRYYRDVFVVGWRRAFIRVYLSKVLVNCTGVDPVCKFLFKSEMWFDYGYYSTRVEYEYWTRTATAASECCKTYAATDGLDAFDCGTYGDYPIPTLSCSSFDDPTFLYQLAFIRYKLFDTLPTGTTFLTFDNDSTFPAGCDTGTPISNCIDIEASTNTACITNSTPSAIPTWCSDTVPATTSCTLDGTETVDTDCTTRSWDGEFCNNTVTIGPVVTFECGDIVQTRLVSGSCLTGCGNFYGDPAFTIDPEIALDGTTPICQTYLKPESEMPTACLYQDPCPPYGYVSKFGPVLFGSVGSSFQSLVSYTLTINCGSFTSASICIGAEPWTFTMVV